jgi:hypothetical protein
VHFFCRPELNAKTLFEFIGNWKSWTSRKIHALNLPRSTPAATTLWQREFFDHVLRSAESYRENGITFETILFVPVWFLEQMNGSMLVRSRR